MAEYFIKAGEELGYSNVDLNARFSEGYLLHYLAQFPTAYVLLVIM